MPAQFSGDLFRYPCPMTLPLAKKSLLDQLRYARFLCYLMVWLTLSNFVFATVCSAHDAAHAIHRDAGQTSVLDQAQPHPDEKHDFGVLDSHCMHATGVHAPCIAGFLTVPIVLTARHGHTMGAFPAPPSRPNDNLLRPPSFN